MTSAFFLGILCYTSILYSLQKHKMTSAFFLGILIRHRYLLHYIEEFCSPVRRDLLKKLMEKKKEKKQARKQTTTSPPPTHPAIIIIIIIIFIFFKSYDQVSGRG